MLKCLSREDLDEKKFVFISYSHYDKLIVDQDIEKLVNLGVNIWYDCDMEVGDNWTHLAENIIKHPNCVGVIFYCSRHSFQSEAVHMERKWTKEKLENIKKNDLLIQRVFFYLCVNIDGDTTNHILRNVYINNEITDENINNYIKIPWVKLIAEMFSDETLYLKRNEAEINEFYQIIFNKTKEYCATNDIGYLLEKLAPYGYTKNVSGKAKVIIGSYKSDYAKLPIQLLKANNGRINDEYIIENEQAYRLQSVSWSIISHSNETLTILSDQILDVYNGGLELEEWLKNIFLNLAFKENEKKLIKNIRLLSVNELENVENLKLPNQNPDVKELAIWWLKENSISPLKQQVADETGKCYPKGYLKTSKVGIRPVLELDTKKLYEIINKGEEA